ncbi:MAG TPA: hypothetical protein VNO55_26335 [Polyangia bacterium]|nr:hypothetical protein [Polyangia bacterium]
MHQGKPHPDSDDTLYLSPDSRELLRQILRRESLESESELVAGVKEALRMQYSRGFHEGAAEGAKGLDQPDVPVSRGERRKLSSSVHRSTESSQERRKKRRQRRFRRRLRKAAITTVMLVLAGAVILAINVARPPLSADNPRARHRIDFGSGR